MPSFRQTPPTPTRPSPSRAATAQWAACQRLFFELPNILNPRPFTGYLGVGPFNHQVQVRIGQGPLQGPDPPLHLIPFVNFIWLLHADHLSQIATTVSSRPFLKDSRTANTIFSPHRIKGFAPFLELPHQGHFECLTVPYSRLPLTVILFHR